MKSEAAVPKDADLVSRLRARGPAIIEQAVGR